MAVGAIERKLAAIMMADVAGFSRLMERDESRTFERLRTLRDDVTHAAVLGHGGRIIKTTGDGFLAEFPSATAAVKCGVQIQRTIISLEAPLDQEDRIQFRIGIHIGDVIIDGSDVAGDGVNIAARLESIAPLDGLCISSSAREQIRDDLGIAFQDLGDRQLKNIARPIRAYAVTIAGGTQVTSGVKPDPAAGHIDVSLPDKPSIAVLPFTNMSHDPEQEYFTDGVTEDIITELSRFHSLFVIARNSTFTYKGKAVDVRTVARELGVRYVLEGSIRRSGDRIRVTGQLIDALTGNHIWAERYDRTLEDVFAVQEEVTRSIVKAIAPQIDAAEREHAQRRRPENLTAYEIAVHASAILFAGGRKYDHSNRDDAIARAGSALAIDPRSTLALNTLAYAKYLHVFHRTAADIDAAWKESLAASDKAIEVDPSDSRAYIHRGLALMYANERDRWDEALGNLRQAHQLNPNDGRALSVLGWIEVAVGNLEKGMEYLHQAVRTNPRNPGQFNTYHYLAQASFLSGDYVRAIEYAQLAISETPDFAGAYMFLAVSEVGLGSVGKAAAVLEKARHIAPGFIQSRLDGGMPFRDPEHLRRVTTFLRVAAGVEDLSAADALR